MTTLGSTGPARADQPGSPPSAMPFATGTKDADVTAICGTGLVETMPETGRTFTRHKCIGPQQQGTAYSEKGVVVAPDLYQAAHMAEVQARYDKHGFLDDEALALEAQCQLGTLKSVPILVWARNQPEADPPMGDKEKPKSISLKGFLTLMQAHVDLMDLCAVAGASKCDLLSNVPAVSMTVPCANLSKIAKDSRAARIFGGVGQPKAAGGTFPYTAQAMDPYFYSYPNYINGYGTGVCVLEPTAPGSTSYYPNTVTIRTNTATCADSTPPKKPAHAQVCGGMITNSQTYGIAISTDLFFANWCNPSLDSYYTQVNVGSAWCAAQSVANWSYSQASLTDTDDAGYDALFDYQAVRSPYPFIATVSANVGVSAKSAHRWLYNGLVIGGTDEQSTSARANDVMWTSDALSICGGELGSGALNDATFPTTDREVPHIVAPAYNVDAANYTGNCGTSFAAPQVAAAGALLDQLAPNIADWPEAKRALILAGANENISGDANPLANPYTDDQDGAGELNAYLSMTIAVPANHHQVGDTPSQYGYDYNALYSSSGTWWQDRCPGEYGCSGGQVGYRVQAPTTLPSNAKLRVVLAWDGTACGGSAWNEYCNTSTQDADLDLYVCVDGGSCYTYAGSYTAHNTWEMVQFPVTSEMAGATFEIFINKFSWYSSSSFTYFGIAWAVDSYSDN